MFRRLSAVSVVLLLATSSLLACGDSGQASFTTANSDNRPDPTNSTPDPTNQNQEPDPEVTYELQIVGDDHHELRVGEHVDLAVRLVESTGQAVQNQAIAFQIIDGTGDANLRLEAGSVFVNEDGQASNRLRVGDTTGQITVHATHQWVDHPAEFTVDVDVLPVGDLQVHFEHDEQDIFPLSDLEVRIWPQSLVFCPTPAFGLPVEAPLDEGFAATIHDTHTFSDLNSATDYTVSVMAFGPDGQISGRGCITGISITPDAVTDATVPLELIPLTPAGEYDVTSFWDFGDALASTGNVGSTIVDVIDALADPAGYIVGVILDLADDFVCDYYGESASSAESCLCDYYGWLTVECAAAQVGGSYIRNQVEDFVTEFLDGISIVQTISEIGTDLRDTVRNMKIDSILTIDNKAVGEGEVEGTDTWLGMYFYWTRNCGPTDPADCGEIYIGLGSDSEFGVMEAEWDGRVFDYNQLEIDPHEMVMPYGDVILYILNNTILPALTGGNANSLGDALDYWICSNIGSTTVLGISIPVGTLCTTAVSLLDIYVQGYLSGLTFDIDLHVSGLGTMVDLESNSLVDVIEDGTFLGQLYNEDGEATDIDATFTAVRRD